MATLKQASIKPSVIKELMLNLKLNVRLNNILPQDYTWYEYSYYNDFYSISLIRLPILQAYNLSITLHHRRQCVLHMTFVGTENFLKAMHDIDPSDSIECYLRLNEIV